MDVKLLAMAPLSLSMVYISLIQLFVSQLPFEAVPVWQQLSVACGRFCSLVGCCPVLHVACHMGQPMLRRTVSRQFDLLCAATLCLT